MDTPRTVNVPRGVIELRIWAFVGYPDKTDMTKKITHCGSGLRCILAAKSLQDLGFSDVTAADMRIGRMGEARLSARDKEVVNGPNLPARGPR